MGPKTLKYLPVENQRPSKLIQDRTKELEKELLQNVDINFLFAQGDYLN